MLWSRSPVNEPATAVFPATTVSPAPVISAVAPFGPAVAPFASAFAVAPLAATAAVFEFVAATVAPFALGDEFSVDDVGIEEAAPVTIAGLVDA